MNDASPQAGPGAASPSAAPPTYRCGTLTFTKLGLVGLFAWLLWGDFCFTMMETVVPTILPLKLRSLGCPNWLLGAVLTFIPNLLNMTVCPYVSYKSDRHRGRWGRRLPFIFWTLPFLCISLVLIGRTDELTHWLRANATWVGEYAPATVSIGLLAVLIALFRFFDMFVGSVFYYLFNDVVPPQFVARFIGTFRIVGTLAGMVFNFFVFQYAESHMKEIFLGTALLYLAGFGLMCLMVREGKYPPVEEAPVTVKGGRLQEIGVFFRESFTHKIYWMVFLYTSLSQVRMAINPFWVFFSQQMGLPLRDIGMLSGLTAGASLVAMYVASVFIDRWHPLRVTVYMQVFGVLGSLGGWVWVFVTLPGSYFFWLGLGSGIVDVIFNALGAAGSMPLFMRLFPQSRFGQFCSAQAMLRSGLNLFSAILAGLFIDVIRRLLHSSGFEYRFIFVWLTLGSLAGSIVTIITYREWYRRGGDRHYHPPATWDPKGYEEMPVVPTVGPQTRWLNCAFRLFDAIMIISVAAIPLMMAWMRWRQAATAFSWHAWLLLPASILVWIYWIAIKRGIRRDMERARAGEAPRNGIPHHGVLVGTALHYLLLLSIWMAQVFIAVKLGMESSAVIFTLGNLVTNLLLVATVQVLCRVERGFSTRVDEALVAEPVPQG